MTCYVGDLGGMVRIPCMSALDVTVEQPVDRKENLTGDVIIYVRRSSHPNALRGRRSWAAKRDVLDPAELAPLRDYLQWADGPHRLITCDAANQNLLTPGQSAFRGWLRELSTTITPIIMGPGETVNGPAGVRAQLGTVVGAVWHAPVVPVLPGVPVTWPVHHRSIGSNTTGIRLRWTDAAGSPTLGVTDWVEGQSTSGPMPRLHVTATPPAGAAGVRLEVRGAPIIANTNPTWTDQPMPYVAGRGATAVHFPQPTEQVILATTDRALSSASFVMEEVGGP